MLLTEVDRVGTTISHLIESLDANVSMTSFCESSALHFACATDNVDAVRILLQNGAHIGSKNIQRKTGKDLTSSEEVCVCFLCYLERKENGILHLTLSRRERSI